MKIVLIPAYEPDYNLVKLVKDLHDKKLEIILINDGSDSSFNIIFEKCKKYCKLISYENNMGKGYALKTGLKYIKENYKKPYVVITMDSDGQHKVEDALKLGEYVFKNDNKLILGKRIRSKKTPLRSRLGNGITRVVYKLCTKNDVYDTQTGLRAFSDKLIDFLLSVNGNRFEYEMNVLMMCSRNNIRIDEVEIETIYIDKNSNSHFNTLKDSFRVYKEILKFSFSSIISFIVDYVFYVVFLFIFKNIIISNVFARIISGTLNYNLNKKYVFMNDKSKTFIEYLILAIFILIFNTLILNLLIKFLLINAFISKILTEIILFVLSFFIQKKFIFKREYQ